ncbi:Ctr copper transporter family-domain-containing protein [Hypoxylon sp. FL1150]|nr:Ctr copper transporter family-domain-containing protein [Hypoxylon sp. FL1150]
MDSMTMATSTSMSGMTMTSTSSMPSSTAMDMDMDMDTDTSSTMMTSASMAMVFFQSVTTPLYSSGWTPQGTGSYAGTCIFLIVLGLVHRILIALRSVVFDSSSSSSSASTRRAQKTISSDSDDYPGSSSELELAGSRVRTEWNGHPFRMATETARACLEVVISGIGYLLYVNVVSTPFPVPFHFFFFFFFFFFLTLDAD